MPEKGVRRILRIQDIFEPWMIQHRGPILHLELLFRELNLLLVMRKLCPRMGRGGGYKKVITIFGGSCHFKEAIHVATILSYEECYIIIFCSYFFFFLFFVLFLFFLFF